MKVRLVAGLCLLVGLTAAAGTALASSQAAVDLWRQNRFLERLVRADLSAEELEALAQTLESSLTAAKELENQLLEALQAQQEALLQGDLAESDRLAGEARSLQRRLREARRDLWSEVEGYLRTEEQETRRREVRVVIPGDRPEEDREFRFALPDRELLERFGIGRGEHGGRERFAGGRATERDGAEALLHAVQKLQAVRQGQ